MASSKTKRRPKSATPSAWSWYAHAPLRGMTLMRESLGVVAWDDARHLTVLDPTGQVLAETRMPWEIHVAAAADAGTAIVCASHDGQLVWMNGSLETLAKLSLGLQPTALAVDPLGEEAAVCDTRGTLRYFGADLEKLRESRLPQAVKYLAYVPEVDLLLAAAEQGMLAGLDGDGSLLWKQTMYTTVGGIAVDATAQRTLLAAYSSGLLGYGRTGKRTTALTFDRSPNLVAVDFAGTRIAAFCLDGFLVTLDADGRLLAEQPFGDKGVGLALDALGRFLVVGLTTGEVRQIPWEDLAQARTLDATRIQTETDDLSAALQAPVAEATLTQGAIWKTLVVGSLDEGASALLEPIGVDRQIGVLSSRKSLRVYDAAGDLRHESVRMEGSGRSLHASHGWLMATTDRRVLAYDPATATSVLGSFDLFEVSHAYCTGKFGDAILIEACDQISRVRFPEEFLWKHRLPVRVSSVAVDPTGHIGMVLEDHQVVIVSPEGKAAGRFRLPRPQAMMITPGADGGWITATLGEQMLRGHAPNGEQIWADPLPWDAWSLQRLGSYLVVTHSSGQSQLRRLTGERIMENGEKREGARYLVRGDGSVARTYAVDRTIFVSQFDGRLLWRRTMEGERGAFAVHPDGVWVVVDRSLLYFPMEGESRP